MENIGKKFSITASNDMQGFAYNIEKLFNGRYVLDRLASEDENVGENKYKRNFYLKYPVPQGNDVLMVSLKDKKVSINRYILNQNKLLIQKDIAKLSYEVVIPKTDSTIEFKFEQDMKKSICVFDIQNKEELVPACSYNKYDKQLKGKFKLNANRKYIVINYEK